MRSAWRRRIFCKGGAGVNTLLIAAAAMAGGAALGFSLCWVATRLAAGNHAAATRLATAAKKKMGTMDKVLILEGVILVAYTAADLAVFLPDYQESRGAMVEWAYCQRIGKDCAMYLDMTGGRTQ